MKLPHIALAMLLVTGASTLAAAAADAQPYRHGYHRVRVCRTYFRHGHRTRVCRFR